MQSDGCFTHFLSAAIQSSGCSGCWQGPFRSTVLTHTNAHTHTHTHTYARSFHGTHLVPYTFTCHLWNQHRKAANAPHRQLECRTQHPSPLHSSSFALLSQGARDASAYLSCHADRAVIIDFSLLECSRSQKSTLLIILLLSCRLIFCLANMAADITMATKCNS